METRRAIAILVGIAGAACLISATWVVARRAPGPPADAPAPSDELRAARDRIARLEGELAALRARVGGPGQEGKSGPGDAAPKPPPPPPRPPVKGMVLAADNRADVYLLSAGREDGVAVGDEFTVFRGDAFVADVVVDKVFADKCAVAVKMVNGKPMKKSDIQQADRFARVE